MTVMVGFQWGGNVRGTIDVIWSCVLVLITAVWTVIHINIPAPGDGLWATISRRLRWGCACVFAPDMLTLVAASQWDAAAKSVKAMSKLEQVKEHPNKWQMEHAFYANSGGFTLQCTDCRPFPVNAKSIQYLVSREYIQLPDLTTEEIWDKSKADVFAKGATIFQGLWLVTQSIAREVQGLPITPLELFTLAFVVSTIMSYYFWWRKPQNVSTNTMLLCDFSTARIRAEAGLPPDGWEQTPLDWVEMEGRRWKRRKMFSDFGLETTMQGPTRNDEEAQHLPQLFHSRNEKSPTSTKSGVFSRNATRVETTTTLVGEQTRPIQRMPNDAIMPSDLSPKVYAGLVIPSIIHSCIHLLGWNMDYPSDIEKQLWRASTVALAAMSCIAVGAVRLLSILGYKKRFNLVFVWVNAESSQSGIEARKSEGGRWRQWLAKVVAFVKDVTAAEILLTLATFVLVLARLYIIVEVIISLRSQPAGVYVSLDWLSFLPHV